MALLDHGVPRWNRELADGEGGELPHDAYEHGVAALPPENRATLSRAAGPAIKYAAIAVFLHFLLWLLTPFAEYALAECPTEGEEGVVQAPLDILTLVGYALFFAPAHLWCQWKCMKYAIIPQLQATQSFNFLGININTRFSYMAWYCVFAAFTCGATLNTLTNGQVLGRIVATYACGAPYEKLEENWKVVMNHAIWHVIPGFRESSFLRESIFAYILQLATPAFAFMYAFPKDFPTERANYVVNNDADIHTYATLYNRNFPTDHGAVLMVLASLARFESLTFQANTYSTTMINQSNRPHECLRATRMELERAIARFAIIGLLQDALQTTFQTTVVGMDWRLAGENRWQSRHYFMGGLDRQMFFSVVVCFFNTVGDLADSYDVMKLVGSGLTRCRELRNQNLFDDEDREQYKHIKRKLRRFSLYFLVFFTLLAWSWHKLIALFVCPKHLWDFRFHDFFHFDFMAGCA